MTRISDMTDLAALPATLAYVPIVYNGINYKFDLASAIDVGLDAQLTSVASLSYTGNALKAMRVNAGETAFELATITSFAWTILDDANAAAVRTTIGTVIGTDVQAYNANLTTYASITPSANVQTLLGSADFSAFRTSLSLVIGTNVQAYNANLTTYAGIAPSANVQTLLGAASFAAFNTSLGLGTGDSPQFTAINLGHASDTTLTRVSAGVAAIEGSNILMASNIGSTVAPSGTQIGQQIFTSGSGTYTPTSGTKSVIVKLQGAGGGGSGVASPTGTSVARGVGGAAGGYLEKRLASNFSGASYAVGAKGTGGTAGANAGNVGGNTTFTDTAATVYTAAGGAGGSTLAAATAPFITSAVAGGASTNGDLNITGQNSIRSIAISSTVVQGGGGGNSQLGSGASAVIINSANSTGAGTSATHYGSGGASGCATGTGAAAAGGDGGDGIIIILEFA